MQELASIFKAEPKSVYNILCQDNRIGFYMPAYQRPYSWTERNIKDLFIDLDNVYRRLLKSDDAIIFLGTLLTVDDDGSATFPRVDKQHPSQIKLVIDGQQRITTLTLLIICLHEQLNIKLSSLKKDIEGNQHEDGLYQTLEGLEEFVLEAIEDTSSFVITTSARHDLYKFQPKIIRSQVDCWGKDGNHANYSSPLAKLLIKYQQHNIEQAGNKSFKAFDEKCLSLEEDQVIKGNIKELRKQLRRVMNGFFDDLLDKHGIQEELFIPLEKLKSDNFETCLDFTLDDSLLTYAKNTDYISALLYLTSFTKFVLRRVCLTYVEVNSESYAFDMFEALNTTGEPLTAFETFVPKVIEHIQKKDDVHERKAALNVLNSISSRFEGIKKTAEKNKLTKALILAFVRAYEGPVKVTHLRDQRDSFLQSYSNCHITERDIYTEQLKYTSDFLNDRWLALVPSIKGLVPESELEFSDVCFRYLTDIKHDIAISLLIQFALKDKRNSDRGTEHNEFLSAIKIVTAFSVLWRAMSGGADGIDSVYKRLHERTLDINSTQYNPFQLKDGFVNIKFNVLKDFFKQELYRKIESKDSIADGTREQWLEICSSQNHLGKPDNQKLLILSGFHNMEFIEGDFIRSENERNNFFNIAMWNKVSEKNIISSVFTSRNEKLDSWSSDLRDIEVNQKLGNVLIDPNGSIKSQALIGWRDLAGIMQSELNDDSITNIDKLVNSELSDVGKVQAANLKLKRKYTELIYAQEWNEEAVRARTSALLSNSWINLHEWLV